PLIETYQPVLNRILHQLRRVSQSELVEYMHLVCIDSLDADEEFIGNFLIGFAGSDKRENLLFARREVVRQGNASRRVGQLLLLIEFFEHKIRNGFIKVSSPAVNG